MFSNRRVSKSLSSSDIERERNAQINEVLIHKRVSCASLRETENTLVSIVIPGYNVLLYLDRCVASVTNQSYTNLQIILVDDGYTGGWWERCDQWAGKDARITVLHQKTMVSVPPETRA